MAIWRQQSSMSICDCFMLAPRWCRHLSLSDFCIVRGHHEILAKYASVTCERVEAKPKPQLLGLLPFARLKPGDVFSSTGVDYAGPIYIIKSGPVRKPIITKSYAAVFVSLSVKAVHLEPVTELITSAFVATLRRFIARRGIPSTMWSENGTNLVDAAKEMIID